MNTRTSKEGAKVSIVLHDLRGGGAEKMMVRLANQMAEFGDDVELVLLTQGGVNKDFVSSEVTLVELNADRTLNAIMPLRKHLKQRNADAILAVLTHVNVITSLVCLSLGMTKRLTVSERNTFSLDKNLNQSWFIRTAYSLAPWCYRFLPNPVIAVSQGVAQDLIDTTCLRESDVTTAPNPVITAQTQAASMHDPKHKWLIEKDGLVVVALGRLSYQKGFDMLLEAFDKVQEQVACKLIIYGEGELRPELTEKIATLGLTDLVDLAGYTDNPLAEIKAADLFVLSSRFEGSPNGLVEAMSVGTSVVAFDCPHGPKEILDGGNVAPLVTYLDVEALCSAMSHSLIEHKDSHKQSSIIDAVARFSSENSARYYKSLIGVGEASL